MNREMERWYGRLATRSVRKPRSPRWAPLLPKGIFVPDLPVFKWAKLAKHDLRDVTINDGVHMQGIVAANRFCRIPEPLEVHFKKKMDKYLVGKIQHIDI